MNFKNPSKPQCAFNLITLIRKISTKCKIVRKRKDIFSPFPCHFSLRITYSISMCALVLVLGFFAYSLAVLNNYN